MLWIRDSSIYQELFETVGKLKSVKMIEVGVAEAVFYKRTDALKAHKEYNQIKLDGEQTLSMRMPGLPELLRLVFLAFRFFLQDILIIGFSSRAANVYSGRGGCSFGHSPSRVSAWFACSVYACV